MRVWTTPIPPDQPPTIEALEQAAATDFSPGAQVAQLVKLFWRLPGLPDTHGDVWPTLRAAWRGQDAPQLDAAAKSLADTLRRWGGVASWEFMGALRAVLIDYSLPPAERLQDLERAFPGVTTAADAALFPNIEREAEQFRLWGEEVFRDYLYLAVPFREPGANPPPNCGFSTAAEVADAIEQAIPACVHDAHTEHEAVVRRDILLACGISEAARWLSVVLLERGGLQASPPAEVLQCLRAHVIAEAVLCKGLAACDAGGPSESEVRHGLRALGGRSETELRKMLKGQGQMAAPPAHAQ